MPNVVSRLSPLARRRLLLAGVALALAAGISFGWHRDIDAQTAATMADRLLGQYRARSGEPSRNFGAREGWHWADGWEFRWRYRPCADFVSLRVWISADGRRARFAELPDCAPGQGLGVPALKV